MACRMPPAELRKLLGEDILGRDSMKTGEDTEIKFPRSATACKWDLKVVFDDKETATWKNFDMCKISEITIKYDGKQATATYK